MAIDAGEKNDGVNGINITPLVDVCLVLVLIFMVTMPFSVLRGIDVKRQTLKKYGLTTPMENVSARLTAAEVFFKSDRGAEKAVPFEDAPTVLAGLFENAKGRQFLVKVERAVPHGRTVWLMDAAKQGGALDISLLE